MNKVLVTGLLLLAMLGVFGNAFAGDEVPRMAPEVLLKGIDSPGVVIIDVRRGSDFDKSDVLIKNAIRKDPGKVESWAGDLNKKDTIVLYCA